MSDRSRLQEQIGQGISWIETVLPTTSADWLSDSGTVWDTLVTYPANAFVTGSDVLRYENISGGPLTGVDPTTDGGVHWFAEGPAGVWTFSGGVISQTHTTADAIIESVLPHPSLLAILQCDIRIPSGQDGGIAALAMADCLAPNSVATTTSFHIGSANGQGLLVFATAAGDSQPIRVGGWIDGQANPGGTNGFDTAILQDEWHTVRALISDGVEVLYIDGAYVFAQMVKSGGNSAMGNSTPPTTVDRVHLGAVGLAQFRNVKLWTQALP